MGEGVTLILRKFGSGVGQRSNGIAGYQTVWYDRQRGALDVKTCVFLDKPARRAVDFAADFRVFEIDDLFVVGYGLDYAGRYRNLPFVGALRPDLLSPEHAEARREALEQPGRAPPPT